MPQILRHPPHHPQHGCNTLASPPFDLNIMVVCPSSPESPTDEDYPMGTYPEGGEHSKNEQKRRGHSKAGVVANGRSHAGDEERRHHHEPMLQRGYSSKSESSEASGAIVYQPFAAGDLTREGARSAPPSPYLSHNRHRKHGSGSGRCDNPHHDDPLPHITVFTTTDCTQSRRVLHELDHRDLPYVEINLDVHPDRRNDMLSLSDRLTVPQVFLGDGRHVGAVGETLSLIDEWDDEVATYGAEDEDDDDDDDEEGRPPRFTSMLERYRHEMGLHSIVADVRLAAPSTAKRSSSGRSTGSSGGGPPSSPMMTKDWYCQSSSELTAPMSNTTPVCGSSMVELPDGSGKLITVRFLTSYLVHCMPRADLAYRTRIYKDCFKGKDGVAALVKVFKLENREQAIEFGRTLQRKQILHHVTNEHMFGDSGNIFFRLQPYHTPAVLNSFRVWTDATLGPKGRDGPLEHLRSLKRMLDKILDSATEQAFAKVDYSAAKKHPEWDKFEEATCALQAVSMGPMDHRTRLAFCINLHNLMVEHAFCKVGIPKTSVGRKEFFRGVKYNVGGDLLSMDDVIHGILRGNAKPPGEQHPHFGKLSDDQRARLSLSCVDPRIHFALHSGGKSAPTVNEFTREGVEEELRIVAQMYCEDHENVFLDEVDGKYEMHVSMIFHWYMQDFCDSLSRLPEVIEGYLRDGGDKKKELRKMIIRSQGKIDVKFTPYDWKTRGSRFRRFDPSRLEPNEKAIAKALLASGDPVSRRGSAGSTSSSGGGWRIGGSKDKTRRKSSVGDANGAGSKKSSESRRTSFGSDIMMRRRSSASSSVASSQGPGTGRASATNRPAPLIPDDVSLLDSDSESDAVTDRDRRGSDGDFTKSPRRSSHNGPMLNEDGLRPSGALSPNPPSRDQVRRNSSHSLASVAEVIQTIQEDGTSGSEPDDEHLATKRNFGKTRGTGSSSTSDQKKKDALIGTGRRSSMKRDTTAKSLNSIQDPLCMGEQTHISPLSPMRANLSPVRNRSEVFNRNVPGPVMPDPRVMGRRRSNSNTVSEVRLVRNQSENSDSGLM